VEGNNVDRDQHTETDWPLLIPQYLKQQTFEEDILQSTRKLIEPKLPGDKLRPLLNDNDENDTQARIQQIQQLDKQRALVDQRLHSNANKMKIYYDKHLKHQNIALKEGEWVLIHNEQRKKFKPHWIGPYK
ncbi:unnamed protein product, partial [Didymodactylos carnosus]